MDWLEGYRDLISECETFPGSVPTQMMDDMQSVVDELYRPLADGSLDPGDLERIRDVWWKHFGKYTIAELKHKIPLQLKLIGLYERLENAPEADWEVFARMVSDARFGENNALVMQSLKGLAESKKAMKDSPTIG